MKALRVFLSQTLRQLELVASEVVSLGHALVPHASDDADVYVFDSLVDFRAALDSSPQVETKSLICIGRQILIYQSPNRGWLIEQAEPIIDHELIVDALIALSKCSEFSEFPEVEFEDHDNGSCAVLNAEDYKKIILDWNNTATDYPFDKTISSLFEEHVVRLPDQIAVFTDSVSLTYKTLDEQANQFAHYLKSKHQVQHEELIAVCLRRNESLIVAILGILKAGAAYVPLDATLPDVRMQDMLQDSRVRLLLVNQEQAGRFQRFNNVDVLVFDDESFTMGLRDFPLHAPACEATPQSLAHVIYTSGTTGSPKGVMIEHENVVSLVSPSKDFTTTSDMTVMHMADFSFDAATYEIFSALLNGARLYLPEGAHIAGDLVGITSALRRHSVDVLFLTKSVFDQLFLFEPTIFHGMKALMVGGEALNHQLVSRLLHSAYRPQRFINLYGPTESSVFVCMYQGDANTIHRFETVPIGKPISNRSVYILDDRRKPVPVGVTGEIYLGGTGVARGYLNQPVLTEEKFIQNPFEVQSNARRATRLYRTGDLGRYLPSGDIEFLGRSDFQVKLRGFRIELTEIEAAMTSFQSVTQAVVLVVESSDVDPLSPDKRLVAFYVAEKEYGQDEWIGYLRQKLPAHMIPSQITFLSRLPLASNGKLDRMALTEMVKCQCEMSDEIISWETSYQEFIAKIWTKVLPNRTHPLSLDSDFLALGGHSLLITRIIIDIRQAYGVTLPSSAIYTYSRLGDLAAHLQQCVEQQFDFTPDSRQNDFGYRPFSLIDEFSLVDEREKLDDAYPASSIQKGMLLESEIHPTNAYLNVMTFRFNVPLDIARLKKIWQKMVDLNEGLRTSYSYHHKYGILARVHRDVEVASKISFIHGNTLTEKHVSEELRTKYTWEDPGLFRIRLFQEQYQSFQLVFTFHHAILDGWSAASLIAEFYKRYVRPESVSGGRASLLPWYGEYVRDEHAAIRDTHLHECWRAYLDGFVPQHDVNWRFEPSRSTHSRLDYRLDDSLSKELTALAEKKRTSIDTLFLVAYIKLLEVFYSSEDFSVGLVFHNRINRDGGDALLGCFLNTVPLRCQGLGDKTYEELIEFVIRGRLLLEEYKALPYVEIKGLSAASGCELFQAAFAYTNFPIFNEETNGVEQLLLEDVKEQSSIPLNLDISRQSQAFHVFFTADSRHVDGSFLSYLNTFFLHYLAEMVVATSSKPTRFPQAELERVLVTNNHLKNSPVDTNVIVEFERICASSPESIAVVCDGNNLTYGELNETANRFARTLMAKGVKTQTCVVIMINRSIDFLISMIAAWKINAYYTPVHPDTPSAKLVEILSQLNPQAIVANRSTLDVLKKTTDHFIKRVVCHSSEDQKNRADNLNTPIGGQDIAYTIFTSGSTGLPKGAVVQHQGMTNHIFAKIHDFSITEKDVVAQTASQTFDVHVWQFVTALMVGGSTVVLNGDHAWVPDLLIPQLNQSRVSIFESVPAHLAVILDYVEHAEKTPQFRNLRLLMMNGEGLPATYCSRWFNNYPHIKMANVYGPAECSDDVTHFAFDAVSADWEGYVPIGKPIQNMQLYVLNEHMSPVPDGVVGEVYVGGVGVGLGYLGLPDKTEENFLENPFHGQSKLYKTGDIARRLPDGNLEYFGRKDFQIKIRGQRVELGEIETAILKFDDIKQVVVIPSMKTGQQSLIAFYTSYSTSSQPEDVLRQFLSQKIESYLIPQSFVHLAVLPLNQNGKMDRAALVQRAECMTATVASPVENFSPLEQAMHAVWTEVLGTPVNDLNADFFLSGGNSLSVITLLNKINRQFDVKLPIRWCFEFTTIAHQCASLNASSALNYYTPIIEFKRLLTNAPNLFLIHPGAGSAVIYAELADELKDKMNVYGVESYNIYHRSQHLRSIKDMAEHYASIVLERNESNVFYLAGWSLGGVIAYEVAQQLIARGAEVRTVFLLDSLLPTGDQLEKLQRFHAYVPAILEANGFLNRFPDYYKHDILTALDIEMQALREYEPGNSAFPVKLIKSMVSERIPEHNTDGGSGVDLAEINRLFNAFNLIHDNGWGPYCEHLTIHEVEGGHASLVSDNKERVSAIIKESIFAIQEPC